MPAVIDAAFRYWHTVGRIVPIDVLLRIGARQLGEAIARQEPLSLDFATPICDVLREAG